MTQRSCTKKNVNRRAFIRARLGRLLDGLSGLDAGDSLIRRVGQKMLWHKLRLVASIAVLDYSFSALVVTYEQKCSKIVNVREREVGIK